jgi:hypothetical protein
MNTLKNEHQHIQYWCEHTGSLRIDVIEVLPPFSGTLKNLILDFSENNAKDGYKENYLNNPSDNRTVAYLLEHNIFSGVYLCFIDYELTYFSGIRDVNGEMMLAVRLITRKNKGDIRPFHQAYVIPKQIERAKKLGYDKCFASYNVGTRTALYHRFLKLQKSNSTEKVTQKASFIVKQFKPENIKIINNTLQFYVGLNLNEFIPPADNS